MKPDTKKVHARKAKQFVSALRRLKKDAGLENSELADLIDVPARTVQSWLSGAVLPPEERMLAATDVLRFQYTAACQLASALEKIVLPPPATGVELRSPHPRHG